ncbi:MAG TPA: PP0621 family protein [Usitatibacter sp.]|nr:PP0621 family protein [Usitatibacter sp.]
MGRIIFLLIIVFLIWLVFRGFFRAQTRRKADAEMSSSKAEDMVACARCGVNLPRSEALPQGNAFICRDNPKCIASP